MSIFRRRGVEVRAIGDPFGVGLTGQGLTGSAEDQALRLSAVFASVRLLADNVSTVPFTAYRQQSDGSSVKMPSQPAILTDPSPHGTVIDWRFRLVSSLALRGNAYGLPLAYDSMGRVTAIEWLNPDDVNLPNDSVVEWPPRWEVMGRPVSQLIHLPWFVLPGKVQGLSPIGAFKALIEQGLYAEAFGRDWFANGSVPAGMIQSPDPVSKPEAEILKSRFKDAARNRDLVALGGDFSYTPISVAAEESQFLATIKATATQIAAIFGVPQDKVGGDAAGSRTYANVEQEALDFVTFTLRPYFVRIETLLTDLLPKPQIVRAETDELIRTSTLDRYNSNNLAILGGWMNPNEVRRRENLPPREGGDDFKDTNPPPPEPPTTSPTEDSTGGDSTDGGN